MIRAMLFMALLIVASATSPVFSATPGVRVTNATGDLNADIRMSFTYPGHPPLRCDEYPIAPNRNLFCQSGDGFSGSIRVDLWTPIVYPVTKENQPKKVATCSTTMKGPGNFRIVKQGSGCIIVAG